MLCVRSDIHVNSLRVRWRFAQMEGNTVYSPISKREKKNLYMKRTEWTRQTTKKRRNIWFETNNSNNNNNNNEIYIRIEIETRIQLLNGKIRIKWIHVDKLSRTFRCWPKYHFPVHYDLFIWNMNVVMAFWHLSLRFKWDESRKSVMSLFIFHANI